MKDRRRRLPWVLMALGALMALCALGFLMQTPNVLQYTIAAPEPGENNANITALITRADKLWETMQETFAWMSVDGQAGRTSITAGSVSTDVNLVAMGEGWLEVYPRFLKQGRRISETELENGAHVIMLDEGLAIQLFGSFLAEDATVKLNGVDYSVVGTVRHGGSVFGGRGVGDTVPYDVYVPLKSAVNSGITLETMTLSVVPHSGTGWTQMFQASATQWTTGGEIIDLKKEAMRCTIMARILLLIVGLYVMVGLFHRATDVVLGWFEGYRQALKRQYFKALIPRLLGLIGLTLLVYGVLIGATWLLMSFSVQPVYIFPEWVPENFVEWSSISKVFWSLTSEAARLVRVGTRELRVVAFWGGLMRWGLVLGLLGAALLPKARREKKK